MRGTESLPAVRQQPEGITPARAGNRIEGEFEAKADRDHPRACGEQVRVRRPPFPRSGSPPRVRGTEKKKSPVFYCLGITPARAGNRFRPVPPGGLLWDHPRACGEQAAPPPAAVPRGGITPARAGNSGRQPTIRRTSPDHPRACGEQTKKILLFSTFSFARSMEFI